MSPTRASSPGYVNEPRRGPKVPAAVGFCLYAAGSKHRSSSFFGLFTSGDTG